MARVRDSSHTLARWSESDTTSAQYQHCCTRQQKRNLLVNTHKTDVLHLSTAIRIFVNVKVTHPCQQRRAVCRALAPSSSEHWTRARMLPAAEAASSGTVPSVHAFTQRCTINLSPYRKQCFHSSCVTL